ncbi:hypothetical protein E2C01_061916 [Portunus trituberculatus]|uniref:Uncharacterized protein n=1 Tax=Portunus trituberculatus TaxID=210409 RepID=A0A5B7HC96_PORTR|nr:hypothetical protein [Portunus trituberculatus]
MTAIQQHHYRGLSTSADRDRRLMLCPSRRRDTDHLMCSLPQPNDSPTRAKKIITARQVRSRLHSATHYENAFALPFLRRRVEVRARQAAIPAEGKGALRGKIQKGARQTLHLTFIIAYPDGARERESPLV